MEENKQFPEQESSTPEELLTQIPAETEPEILPDPVLPEFADEARSPELEPAVEAEAAVEEPAAETEPEMPAEEPPARDGAEFMNRIPDVDEDYPEEAEAPAVLEEPMTAEVITADKHAMDAHGLREHGEEEEDFDMSLLQPSVLPPEEPAEEEDVTDQEYRDNGKDFDEIFHAPASEEPSDHPRSARKGRPKRKKGEGLLGIPSILVTFVWLALVVTIGVTAGRLLWVCAADVLAFGREDRVVTVTIYEADTMDDITNKLYDAGLIRYRSLFSFYAEISDAEEDIKPGIYDLNTRYDYHALVNFMSPRSSREVITLTIPEGYSCRQIFALLEEHRICTAVDLAAYAANGELDDYWFLQYVERGSENCLEGFLFPDTYEFYKNSTPREALQKMLNNFEYRFTAEMMAGIDTLNATTGGNYSIREVVIVASLIEKESAAPAESPRVAGVIYNRLFRWGNTPAYLNIDATIVYAQGGDAEHIDTGLDSPYNTYTHIGLPPTAIANPGLSSLLAALNPENHNYYYYVLNPSTGMHQFSTTQEEHNAWIDQFYR